MRRKPMKRTELRRGDKPLTRSAPLPRGDVPLPRQSTKAKAKAQERRVFVARILRERPWCEAHPVLHGPVSRRTQSMDVHELVRRSQGGSITDADNVLAVCRFPCHAWIGDNPREAERRGLCLPSWATDAMIAEAVTLRLAWSHGKEANPSWWNPATEVGRGGPDQ